MPHAHSLRVELANRLRDVYEALEREGEHPSEMHRKARFLEDALGSLQDVSIALTRDQMREAFELLLNREIPAPNKLS